MVTEAIMRVLVTGAAGFIGCQLALRLLAGGHEVTGLDNCNDYYDTRLKKDRLARISGQGDARFRFVKGDLADAGCLNALFSSERFTHVVNMAAQAGVRYSLVNPAAYISSNLAGFGNLLECCRKSEVQHLVFASSSSVYGLNTSQPFATRHNTDHPASLYAATKKSNELMAHAYSHLYRLPCTGLRFFTVYGPWGRPDMAPHIFATAIARGEAIKVFNNGRMRRDFTYIDDIVEGVTRLLPVIPAPDPAFDPANPDPSGSSAPWRIYNIGNNRSVELNDFISELENALGRKARRDLLPMQPGDVEATWADISDLAEVTGFAPATPLSEGIARFIAWHKEYYGL
jgi:UDP-glucuronate 4-epimerase